MNRLDSDSHRPNQIGAPRFGLELVLALCMALGSARSTAFAQGGAARLDSDFPTLYKAYGANFPACDYVLVIDRSGSMRTLWPHVQRAIKELSGSLSDGDYLSVIGFNQVSDDLVIPRQIDASTRSSFVSDVAGLQEPSGNGFGAWTDLWLAADSCLAAINRPNANAAVFCFWFTDFDHDAASNSKSGEPNSIAALEAKYVHYLMPTNRYIKTYALQLPLGPAAGTDYEKFAHLFVDRISRIKLNASSLVDWITRIKLQVARDKLAMSVERDLAACIVIDSAGVDKDAIALEIRSASQLPFKITRLKVKTVQFGDIESAQNVLLSPGSTVNVTLPFDAKARGLFSTLEKRHEIGIDSIVITADFGHAEEFGRLNLAADRTYTLNTSHSAFIVTGLPYMYLGAIVLVAFMLFWLVWRRCLRPEYTFSRNSFKIEGILNDRQSIIFDPCIFGPAEKAITIDNSAIRQPLPDLPQFAIIIKPHRPKCVFKDAQRGTYVLTAGNSRLDLYDHLQRQIIGPLETAISPGSSPVVSPNDLGVMVTWNHAGHTNRLLISFSLV